MKSIVELRENRHRYINCTFCDSSKENGDIKELCFTKRDGNGNVFHVCESCLDKIKEEVNKIDFKR